MYHVEEAILPCTIFLKRIAADWKLAAHATTAYTRLFISSCRGKILKYFLPS